MAYSEWCTECGNALESTGAAGESPRPCPACGSIRRTLSASVTESVIARDGMRMKAKRQGQKEPYFEARSEPSYSVTLQKHVHLERVIDRDADRYSEKVTIYEDQSVMHECNESLSEHQNHGSAKPKV
jgi:hypothetical protein